jgi:hypothetical protein
VWIRQPDVRNAPGSILLQLIPHLRKPIVWRQDFYRNQRRRIIHEKSDQQGLRFSMQIVWRRSV